MRALHIRTVITVAGVSGAPYTLAGLRYELSLTLHRD